MYSAFKPDDTKTPLFNIASLMIVTRRRAVYWPLSVQIHNAIIYLIKYLASRITTSLNTNARTSLLSRSGWLKESSILASMKPPFTSWKTVPTRSRDLTGSWSESWNKRPEHSTLKQLLVQLRWHGKMFTDDHRLMNRIWVTGSLQRFLNIRNRVFVNQMLLKFKDKFMSFAPSAISPPLVKSFLRLFRLNPSFEARILLAKTIVIFDMSLLQRERCSEETD
jgi:hypothetical protein